MTPRAPRARVPGAKGRDAARRGAKAEDHRTRLRTARGAEAAVLSRYRVTLVCCQRATRDAWLTAGRKSPRAMAAAFTAVPPLGKRLWPLQLR